MQKYAFMDFDKTIISKDSQILYLVFLYKKGYISIFTLLNALFWGMCYALHIVSAQSAKEHSFAFLNNTTIPVEVNQAFVAGLPYFPQAKQEILHLLDKGYTVLIVSASCDVYMQYVKDYLHVHDVICTKFTNRKLSKNCKGKEKIIRIYEYLNNDDIDYDTSIAYGDSKSDTYMMQLVKTKVIVNNNDLYIKLDKQGVDNLRLAEW